ncbi:hypothetical protein ACPYO6_14775 [Georgenia sp. Z1344]|uniref:hypothetical protein n=1 Tax=Georgenia sp. Z1344 TaxID=3416706 RepID=UPI003CF3A1D0
MADGDIVMIGGQPVTTLERTAMDFARLRDPEQAIVTLDHVFARMCRASRTERERVDREAGELRALLISRLRTEFRGARGVRRAIRLVELASPWSESAWESRVRWIVLVWGVRDAVQQCPIAADGHRWWVDLAIPIGTTPDGRPRWLIVEFDGHSKFGTDPTVTSDALMKERRRDQALERAGHTVLHLSASEAGNPALTVERIVAKVPDGVRLSLSPVTDLMPRTRRRTGRSA